jgi:hypothetical protein
MITVSPEASRKVSPLSGPAGDAMSEVYNEMGAGASESHPESPITISIATSSGGLGILCLSEHAVRESGDTLQQLELFRRGGTGAAVLG